MQKIKKYRSLISFVLTLICVLVLYFSYQFTLNYASEYIEVPISNRYLKSGVPPTVGQR